MENKPKPIDSAPTSIRWLTETQTAERLNMSVKWLQKERLHGSRIPFAKFGSAVRYSISDIEQFERDSVQTCTSTPRGGV